MRLHYGLFILPILLAACGNDKEFEDRKEIIAGSIAENKGKIIFRVHKQDVLIRTRSEYIIDSGDSVEVALRGELFSPYRAIPLKTIHRDDRSTPERLLTLDHQANVLDNEELILENWFPEERIEIKQFLDDAEVRMDNRQTVEQIRSMELYGWVTYKGYLIMLVGYNKSKEGVSPAVTMKRIRDQWYLTNALADDEIVGIIWTAHNGFGAVSPN